MSRKSRAAEIELRRKKVAANLLAGLTYREIAEGLNCSLGTVSSDVRILFNRWKREQVTTVADYVALDLRGISRAINGIWQNVNDGSLPHIDRYIRLIERRAKLLGLDTPSKIDMTSRTEQTHMIVYMPDNGRGDGNGEN